MKMSKMNRNIEGVPGVLRILPLKPLAWLPGLYKDITLSYAILYRHQTAMIPTYIL